jgi:hypothetical protein
MRDDSTYRPPTESEKDLVAHLLSADFPGAAALRAQLASCVVKVIDNEGSLSIRVADSPPAGVTRRIPVEAERYEEDGVFTHVLLHVLDGFLNELEIYRDDSKPVLRVVTPEDLKLLVL